MPLRSKAGKQLCRHGGLARFCYHLLMQKTWEQLAGDLAAEGKINQAIDVFRKKLGQDHVEPGQITLWGDIALAHGQHAAALKAYRLADARRKIKDLIPILKDAGLVELAEKAAAILVTLASPR